MLKTVPAPHQYPREHARRSPPWSLCSHTCGEGGLVLESSASTTRNHAACHALLPTLPTLSTVAMLCGKGADPICSFSGVVAPRVLWPFPRHPGGATSRWLCASPCCARCCVILRHAHFPLYGMLSHPGAPGSECVCICDCHGPCHTTFPRQSSNPVPRLSSLSFLAPNCPSFFPFHFSAEPSALGPVLASSALAQDSPGRLERHLLLLSLCGYRWPLGIALSSFLASEGGCRDTWLQS